MISFDTDELDRRLRELDPAGVLEMTPARRERAQSDLERILEAGAPTASTAFAGPSRSRALIPRRWAVGLAGAAAACTTVVLVVGSTLGVAPAYADWTETPTALEARETAMLADACRDRADLPHAQVEGSERRGDHVALIATDAQGRDGGPATVFCLARFPAGSARVSQVETGVSGGRGAVPSGPEFTDGGMATFTDAGPFGIGERGTASFVRGEVGEDVASLAITDGEGHAVTATVKDGHYLAWWPGDAFSPTATEGSGGPAPGLAYTVTLRDGTVLRDARPAMPR